MIELKEFDDNISDRILTKSHSLLGYFYAKTGGYESWLNSEISEKWTEEFSKEQIIVQNNELIAFFRHPLKYTEFNQSLKNEISRTVLLISYYTHEYRKTGLLLNYACKYWDDEYLKIICR